MPVLELTDEQVIALIQDLPEAQQQRVMALIAEKKSPRKRPQFGGAKNDILFVAEDFDAPLDDFKEYME
jgi:Protein of unknown function (DUF2281)